MGYSIAIACRDPKPLSLHRNDVLRCYVNYLLQPLYGRRIYGKKFLRRPGNISYKVTMVRSGTLFKRYEIFVAAAAIAAHANWGARGFRQRDLRFLIELFTNWVEGSLAGGEIALNNTQVLRYLESLAAEGYAKVLSRQKQPRYRLTRLGLLELLTRLSNRPRGGRPEHFFFLFYFLSCYAPRITELIKAEGKHFPSAMRIEIEALLDYGRLLEEEVRKTQLELRKLEERISDSTQSSRLATKLFAQGAAMEEVVAELEKKYPYELNSQKPLSELFADIPPDIGRWELELGNTRRVTHLWLPTKQLLRSYLDALRTLERDFAGARS